MRVIERDRCATLTISLVRITGQANYEVRHAVGLGWQGTIPQGVKRVDAPTPWVELQPRVFVKDQSDLAAAKSVLDQITITGLAKYEGRPAPTTPSYQYAVPDLDPNIASSKMPFKDPTQFWTICSAAMNENPPPQAQIEAVLPQYKSLGLELGKHSLHSVNYSL